MARTFDFIDEKNGVELYRSSLGQFHVVEARNNQVFSIMPGDAPAGGGQWMARASDYGIGYVSGGYSRSYARRMFRQLAEENADGCGGCF